ncbi:MAG: hypothetical protein IPL40_11095 [Proteobacteria bacterium]|nr:hypothetical protein [Pseudomonadota bacterium]
MPTIAAVAAVAASDVIEVVGASAEPIQHSVLALIGRLHPLTVHFPIAWLLLALLVELGAAGFRPPGWRRATLPLLALAVLSCLPSIASGLFRATSVAVGGDAATLSLIVDHRNLMLGSATCATLALALGLWLRRHEGRRAACWSFRALLVLAATLLIAGSHLGAKLVYGERYLRF